MLVRFSAEAAASPDVGRRVELVPSLVTTGAFRVAEGKIPIESPEPRTAEGLVES